MSLMTRTQHRTFKRWALLVLSCLLAMQAHAESINREGVVKHFSPQLNQWDTKSPFTLGNGQFAFTADISGFQSFGDAYFAAGFPLETKARWAWHSKPGAGYSLADVAEEYDAYGRKVTFPTKTNSPAADWLRQNPHDLPLGRIALLLDGKALEPQQVSHIHQTLDLWQGSLTSQYALDNQPVQVTSVAHAQRDSLAFQVRSPLTANSRLSIDFRFPRGYDFAVKNTPNMDWLNSQEHATRILKQTPQQLLLERKVDDTLFYVSIEWRGEAKVLESEPHHFQLTPSNTHKAFEFSIHFSQQDQPKQKNASFGQTLQSAAQFWPAFWRAGAFVDLTQNTDPRAQELQRRIILSQYILATQARAQIPTQEMGLTSSSWYGKFHTEMSWLSYSHWILWNRSHYAQPIFDWYLNNMDRARAIAQTRGLAGARWPKMVGPDGRESPGGNALIIWNQPHAIHLAETLYAQSHDKKVLDKYAGVVEETAQAMSSMLTWDQAGNRFVLNAPIWISQEIYTPNQTRNPSYELAYWRYGLETAQAWRVRRGLPVNSHRQQQIELLSALPVKDGKYVAMESIPDTFDNPTSREDHPSMLAPTAFFNDRHIDPKIMSNTLDAVLKTWGFDTKIWGWDYPMLAMTAARLNRGEQAVQLLLMQSKNNAYLNNGHCPQQGADLAVYLPANASLLTAVAIMLEKNIQTGKYSGFPAEWKIRTDGFH